MKITCDSLITYCREFNSEITAISRLLLHCFDAELIVSVFQLYRLAIALSGVKPFTLAVADMTSDSIDSGNQSLWPITTSSYE